MPLSSFARFVPRRLRLAIAHQEQFPSVTISFDLNDGLRAFRRGCRDPHVQREIGMPSSVTEAIPAILPNSIIACGRTLADSGRGLAIYIVLGVLYESFIHPLTILSTLPSAGVGALLALMLFGHDLSVIALIGIVLLMGIVKKNAILMIDFAIEPNGARACRRSNRSYKLRCCDSVRS